MWYRWIGTAGNSYFFCSVFLLQFKMAQYPSVLHADSQVWLRFPQSRVFAFWNDLWEPNGAFGLGLSNMEGNIS